MARESTSKMKNGRVAGQSGFVSHMIKSAGDAGIKYRCPFILIQLKEHVLLHFPFVDLQKTFG